MTKYLSFLLFIFIGVVLALTTVVEKLYGTTFVHTNIYGSWWFYGLWAFMATMSFVYIHRVKLQRRLSTYLLHISFVVILAGALLTALTSERGVVYLPLEEEVKTYVGEMKEIVSLPFVLRLKEFEVEYYSGTKAPADYISHVEFASGKEIEEKIVSMNNIALYEGYRFYQTEYDEGGSWLSVNRDIYGMRVTYFGYFLLAVSLLYMLVDRKGAFRALLRSPILKKGMMIVVMLGVTFGVLEAKPRVITKSEAESLDELQVVYNNRVMPISTLARDFTIKITGDVDYEGVGAEQFFWSYLFFPTEWETVPMFEVPESDKQRFLCLESLSSYKDFFSDGGVYKMTHYMRNTDAKEQPALYKELRKLNEKIQLVAMLRSGAMVKIFPYEDAEGNLTWYSPMDSLPLEMERGQKLFIQNSFNMLMGAYSRGDEEVFVDIANRIAKYQQKYGGESLIEPMKFKAEQLYYGLPVPTILYRMNLTIGLLMLLVLMLSKRNNKILRFVYWTLNVTIIHAVAFLSVYIGLKWYISGHIPLTNGYDTMLFLGWSISLASFVIRKQSMLFTSMATLLSGFTMLVASIGGLNPSITPLIPVLNSPYLSTHVCFIMLSYALFGFTFINAVLSLTVGYKDDELKTRLTHYSKIFLMLGIAFLALGIFIGAVWANESWGRYWAWDPKEVWALITMMVYCLPLHSNSIRLFRNQSFFHIYLLLAIVVLFMTYFGVNMILGGMHSYVQ